MNAIPAAIRYYIAAVWTFAAAVITWTVLA